MSVTEKAYAPIMPPRAFCLALGLNVLWINASEVFRYFAFVMPMMREAFPELPAIAPMNLTVFVIWGVWDSILVLSATLIPWLWMQHWGASKTSALLAGSFVWMTIFVILWLGLFNMNLATAAILSVALPLAWLEMVVASLIVRHMLVRNDAPK
ncbi:MAG: hypothetical protein AAGK67_16740 [Pseudomonadota bacterium]